MHIMFLEIVGIACMPGMWVRSLHGAPAGSGRLVHARQGMLDCVPTHTPRLQIVGGVALAHPFYVDALYSEGRVPEGALAGPCQVVFTAPGENGMELIPATQVSKCICR